MDKINLAEKFSHIAENSKPYMAGELNGQRVKPDKLKVELLWHQEREDELVLNFPGKTVWLEGEFQHVPAWHRAPARWAGKSAGFCYSSQRRPSPGMSRTP
jgi:hypothetical protein